MRTLRLLALALVACTGDAGDGDDTGAANDFCTQLASSNEGCWTEDLDDTCREIYAECGEDIVVMESCPVQLGC